MSLFISLRFPKSKQNPRILNRSINHDVKIRYISKTTDTQAIRQNSNRTSISCKKSLHLSQYATRPFHINAFEFPRFLLCVTISYTRFSQKILLQDKNRKESLYYQILQKIAYIGSQIANLVSGNDKPNIKEILIH